MRTSIRLILALTLVTSGALHAHEGHGIPGALPPAPHGGVVQEAEHAGADVHGGHHEKELFFEVVHKGSELRVYPLVLAENSKVFTPVDVKKEVSAVSLKAEILRPKKVQPLTPNLDKDFISSHFESKGVNRFFVHIAANFEKEAKTAKVQIETHP